MANTTLGPYERFEGEAKGTLHAMFERQAKLTPSQTALVDEDGEWQYDALDEASEYVAAHLAGLGVSHDCPVGLYLRKSSVYMVALMGILRAGGAFLTLETATPAEVLASHIQAVDPLVVFTDATYAANLPDIEGMTVIVLEYGADSASVDVWKGRLAAAVSGSGGVPVPGPLRAPVDRDALAFVSMSSGTTGKPKAILNPHHAPVTSYLWRWGLSGTDYVPRPGKSRYTVAANVFYIWESIRPLLRGGTVLSIPNNVIYDFPKLMDILDKANVDEMLFTPSLIESLIHGFDPVKLATVLGGMSMVWLNGEVVTRKLLAALDSLLPPSCKLFNVYSISECHEVSAANLRDPHVLSHSPSVAPVGTPSPLAHIHILDSDTLEPVAAGEAGELFVSGPILARGYASPELTAERFPLNPFALADAGGDEVGHHHADIAFDNTERMYKTGDRVRLLPNGQLEVTGRVNFFVKIRGYSITLSAIETALLDVFHLDSAVVVVDGEEGSDKRLAAYLVPSDSEPQGRVPVTADLIDPMTGSAPSLRSGLMEVLADYMVPPVFVLLSELPIDEASGKLNRKALPPLPSRATVGILPTAPLSAVQLQNKASVVSYVAQVWDAVLALPQGTAGPSGHFFDLGGHSLSAAQLLFQYERLTGTTMSMSALFASPNLDDHVALMMGEEGTDGDGAALAASTADPWHADAAAELGVSFGPNGADPVLLGDAHGILVTGATGFLGTFLLAELLDTAPTGAVVYAAIRPANRSLHDLGSALVSSWARYGLDGDKIAGAIECGRVVVLPADISVSDPSNETSLLRDELVDKLATSIDVIFHCAAAVNLVQPYAVLRDANVVGTHNMLRFASRVLEHPSRAASAASGMGFHYVSTNGIFPVGMETAGPESRHIEGLGAQLGTVGMSGYGQTKWVAEMMMWAAYDAGLRGMSVYRPGNLSGSVASGALNASDSQVLIWLAVMHSGCAPLVPGWVMELTPVDVVASLMVSLAGSAASVGQAFNLTHPSPVSALELLAWLSSATGVAISYLPFQEWRMRTLALGSGVSASSMLGRAAAFVASLSNETELTAMAQLDTSATCAFVDEHTELSADRGISAEVMGPYAAFMRQAGWSPVSAHGKLVGRIALVTGASSGIGAATALALAREGASVMLVARSEGKLAAVAAEAPPGSKIKYAVADVTDLAAVEAAVAATVAAFGGPVDTLVNCAGVMYYTAMASVAMDDWVRTIDVNCKGTAHTVGAVLPAMLEAGTGHIVLISSDAGRKVFPGLGVYSASKVFVEFFAQGLRSENANTGLRVTTIQPGNVATNLLAMTTDADALNEYGAPSGAKILDPEDIANSIVFTISQPEHVAVNEILIEPREEPA